MSSEISIQTSRIFDCIRTTDKSLILQVAERKFFRLQHTSVGMVWKEKKPIIWLG
jgi:hypothetical protein